MMKLNPPQQLEQKSLADRGLVRIERTFEVITPMFGGGVHVNPDELQRQRKNADAVTPIRTASIRGQLRFWWRATSGHRSLEALCDAEDNIWGAASLPGLTSLRLVGDQPSIRPVEVFDMNQARSGRWNPRAKQGKQDLAYGAFPLQPKGGMMERLTPGSLHQLTGHMTLVVETPTEHQTEIGRAIDAWLTFGGVGGRTRRGFGAVAAVSGAQDPVTLLTEVQQHAHAIPGVASLSGAQLKTRTGNTQALKVVELGLGKLRSMRQGVGTGRNPGQEHNRPGRSRWPEAEQIRDLTRQSDGQHQQKLVNVKAFPRAAFGMPIIFHFQSPQDPGDTSLVPEGKERRASPLILRPYRSGNGFRGLALVLTDETRAREQVTLKAGRDENRIEHSLSASQARWNKSPLNGEPDVLQAFLNHFAEN